MFKLQTFCPLAVGWPKEATARGQPWPARGERKVGQARAPWKNHTPHYGYFSYKNLLWANCQLQKFRLLPAQLAFLAALQGILHGLAALGGHGNSPQNCHRDLTRLHFGALASPEPSKVTTLLSCRNAEGLLGEVAHEVPLLLPHHWVQALDEILGYFNHCCKQTACCCDMSTPTLGWIAPDWIACHFGPPHSFPWQGKICWKQWLQTQQLSTPFGRSRRS